MKILISLMLLFALILTLALPNRVWAEDDNPEDPLIKLQAQANAAWAKSADFRASVESTYHVTLTDNHAWRTLKTIFPTTTSGVEADAVRRTGILVEEKDYGAMVTVTGTTRQAASPGTGIPVMGSRLGFIWFAISMNQLIDDWVEDRIVADCLSQGGFSLAQCQDSANVLTDNLRYFEHFDCYVEYGLPGGDNFCMADILNEIERIREHRQKHVPKKTPGEPHYFPPVAEEPMPGMGMIPCGGGYNNSGAPSLPPSPPGSNGTEGNFPDEITVTGRDPCR